MKLEQSTKFPQPFFYLIFQIENDENVQINSLFTEIKSFFENFTPIRRGGWDLKIGTGIEYNIDLKGIEHVDLARRIRVFENGGFIIQGALNGNFLCWRGGQIRQEGEFKKIHSLALIEFTYNSFVALQKILLHVKSPTLVKSEIGFLGINKEFSLQYSEVGSGIFNTDQPFRGSDTYFEENYLIEDLSSDNLPTTVYGAVKNIYRMFGLNETQIPYTTKTEPRPKIDVQKIIGVS